MLPHHVHMAATALGCLLLVAVAAQAGAPEEGSRAAINVNTAPVAELISLPGIGPKKAQAIILYREAHGPFQTVDDLIQVKGIGPKTLEKLRPLVTVGTPGRKNSRAVHR